MSLELARSLVALTESIVTIIAIVVGGIWVLYRLGRERTDVWNLQMNVTPQVLDYSGDSNLLIIWVSLRNIGKIKFQPGTRGCLVSVYSLDQSAPLGTVLEPVDPLMEDINLLRHYDHGGYWLEPQAEYTECDAVIVPQDRPLLVKVAFWSEDDTDSITEYRVVPA